MVGEGVELEDPEYKDLATAISEANQFNFVKYVNDVTKINNIGIADFMFDLAFKSKVNEEETIVWRLELEWIAAAGKAALPYVLDDTAEFEITLAEIIKFEGVFQCIFKVATYKFKCQTTNEVLGISSLKRTRL